MKIFTICDGQVTNGAKIVPFKLKSADIIIPAIIIGEEGRGRILGVLPTNGGIDNTITFGSIGQTKAGKPKLLTNNDEQVSDKCLVVFRTPIGFRGGNSHTGDRKPGTDPLEFEKFPGEVITEGYVAQGDAGGMGGGNQYIAIIPKGVVFRTGYSGRRYGSPRAHYYLFNGEKILSATWEEREISDIF